MDFPFHIITVHRITSCAYFTANFFGTPDVSALFGSRV
jgi:hypothetical protein